MADSADNLIQDLLTDPARFDQSGRAHALLQAYFAGYPLATLRALLTNDDMLIQRSGAFIASELGALACSLLDDVVPLTRSSDGHTVWYAVEFLTVCCKGDQAGKFYHVVRVLESGHPGLRRLAMRMLCNADMTQLRAAQRVFAASADSSPHAVGLARLAGENLEPTELIAMLRGPDPLLRLYGAVGIKRSEHQYVDLMKDLARIDDADIAHLLEWRRPRVSK